MPSDETNESTLPAPATVSRGQSGEGPTTGTVAQSDDEQQRVAAALAPEPVPRGPRHAIPGYEILRKLDRGGMGRVYLARDLRLNREVALKTLRSSESRPEMVARLWAEAEVMAAVRHPNVVQVFELGKDTARPFIAMEYLPGGSLAARLKDQGAMAPRDAAALVEKVARGVAAAHELGVIHRDLKPGNVLLSGPGPAEGEPKVADFGVAKRMLTNITQTAGSLMGTPAYMAPEQARGEARYVGPPADVWALGVILYECVSGAKPFDGETVESVLTQITSTEPPALRARVSGLPRDLDTIVAKCLSKEPALRYPTAAELADDLGRFLRGEPVLARPLGPVGRARLWCRRHPVGTVLILASVFFVVAQSLAIAAVMDAYAAERQAKALAEERERDADQRSREAAAARDAARVAEAEAAQTAAVIVRLVEMSDSLGFQPLNQERRVPRLDEEAARELLTTAVREIRARPPTRSLPRAQLLDSLGSACRSRGLYKEAHSLLDEALSIRRELLGNDNAEVAASLHNQGWLAQDEGRFADAQELYRRALDMRRQHLGDDSSLVTATMFNLAWVTGHQFDNTPAERREAAEKLLREIIERQKRWPDRGHGDPLLTRLALALIVYTPDDAHKKEVEKIRNEVVALLPKHPNSKRLLEGIGKYIRSRSLWDEGKREEAIKLRLEVLEEIRSMIGNEHIVVCYARADIAGLLSAMGRFDEALAQFNEAMRIAKKHFPSGHWVYARTLIEGADKFHELGRHAEAAERYREAMEMPAIAGHDDLWRRARDGRVRALVALKRDAEAEKLRAAVPPPKP
jgi:tetratricopeptide (TPR) repeat protein